MLFVNFVQSFKSSYNDPQLSHPSEGSCLVLTKRHSQHLGWNIISYSIPSTNAGLGRNMRDFLGMYCLGKEEIETIKFKFKFELEI